MHFLPQRIEVSLGWIELHVWQPNPSHRLDQWWRRRRAKAHPELNVRVELRQFYWATGKWLWIKENAKWKKTIMKNNHINQLLLYFNSKITSIILHFEWLYHFDLVLVISIHFMNSVQNSLLHIWCFDKNDNFIFIFFFWLILNAFNHLLNGNPLTQCDKFEI